MEINIYCFPCGFGKKISSYGETQSSHVAQSWVGGQSLWWGFLESCSICQDSLQPDKEADKAYSCTQRKLILLMTLDACLFSLNSFILYMNAFCGIYVPSIDPKIGNTLT